MRYLPIPGTLLASVALLLLAALTGGQNAIVSPPSTSIAGQIPAGTTGWVLSGLTPDQVTLLPLLLRGPVLDGLRKNPQFTKLPAPVQESVIGGNNFVVTLVDPRSPGIVFVGVKDIAGDRTQPQRRQVVELLLDAYMAHLISKAEEDSAYRRATWFAEEKRALEDAINTQARIKQYVIEHNLTPAAPPTIARDAYAQALVDQTRAHAAYEAMAKVADPAAAANARQAALVADSVAQALAKPAKEEQTRARDWMLAMRGLSDLDHQMQNAIARRDHAAAMVSDIRVQANFPITIRRIAALER